MGLETGTFIADLVSSNPVNSDNESQGAAHLRLIKSLLQATFPGASRANPFPAVSASQTASFSVVQGDFNKTFMVDTTAGAVTATLPTLASGDAGWQVFFIKTNTSTNAMFIAPPSGNIQSGEYTGLAKARRCIPGRITRVIWTGTSYIAERVCREPVGTILDFTLGSLPVGYEWANGQTLASASSNYPEFFAANGSSGVVLDLRGRIAPGVDNMGGVAAGVIGTVVTDHGTIVGTTLGSTGGQSTHTQAAGEVGAHGHGVTNTMGVTDDGHQHGGAQAGAQSHPLGTNFGEQDIWGGAATTSSTGFASVRLTGAVSVNNSSAPSAMAWLQPSIMVNKIVVVE